MKCMSKWMFVGVLVGAVTWLSPTRARGQAGYNAVYNSSGWPRLSN